MKISMQAAVALLLIVLLVADTEGWIFGRRRRRRRSRCRFTCWISFGRLVCGVRCSFGKRSISDEGNMERPLPTRFSSYDQDNNGLITLSEFAETVGTTETACRKVFNMLDKDENKLIDEIEFELAPWVRNSNQFNLQLENTEDLNELLEDAKKEADFEAEAMGYEGSGDSDETDWSQEGDQGENPEDGDDGGDDGGNQEEGENEDEN